jgi:hypothetical protein
VISRGVSLIPFLPTIEIVFEARRPSFGGGVAGEIEEVSWNYVIKYGQPIKTRASTILMIENNLAAIKEYKEAGCPGGSMQRTGDFIRRCL